MVVFPPPNACWASRSRVCRVAVRNSRRRSACACMQRSTRKLALTEAGQLFYQHCQAMLSEAQAAVDVVQSLRDSPRGTVRVSVPVTISQTFLSADHAGFPASLSRSARGAARDEPRDRSVRRCVSMSRCACAPSRRRTPPSSRGRCGARSRCWSARHRC